jgi:hypothetical protein
MGIDHLSLSSELVAALYPETLVVPVSLRSPHLSRPPAANTAVYPYFGENKSGIIFLVDYPEEEFLPADQLVFLQKILLACHYKTEDIAIINLARTPVTFSPLKKQLQPRIVFLWGIRAGALQLPEIFPDFVQTPVDGVTLLSVPTPERMNSSQPEGLELKQQLWACLKKLFNL